MHKEGLALGKFERREASVRGISRNRRCCWPEEVHGKDREKRFSRKSRGETDASPRILEGSFSLLKK